MPLEPGQAATVERVVTRDLTADALGNPGVRVPATPFVITLLEHAARGLFEVEAWDEVDGAR
jgi:predicted thioesterase